MVRPARSGQTRIGPCFPTFLKSAVMTADCWQKISITKTQEQELHTEFVRGGIEKAVMQLVKMEPAADAVLAFSVGSSIAWKACLAGWKVPELFLVSGTRLRLEEQLPPANVHLLYGAEDSFRPREHWFRQLVLTAEIIPGQPHELYADPEVSSRLSKKIRALMG